MTSSPNPSPNPSHPVTGVEPTEAMWGGLARSIMMWLDMSPKTPRALFRHLKLSGEAIPQWLRDEPELEHLDHVPSKGTRCVIIWKAMEAARLSPQEPSSEYRRGIEDAAKAVEAELASFSSEEYAVGPLAAFGEKFACAQCIASIRQLARTALGNTNGQG